MDNSYSSHEKAPRSISRREFLRLAAMAGLLAGCGPIAQSAVPTDTPGPKSTQASVLAGEIRRPEIIKMYPDVSSTVIHARHSRVWSGKDLVPSAVREMLDASITKLTGLSDARTAWQALFKPDEQIAIKVNTFSNSIIWTHVPLVEAVTQSLVDAGIPAEQVIVFDATSKELETAGFRVNASGAGVRCFGSEMNYADGIPINKDTSVRLSQILKKADAVINMPILKSHSMAGLTFALKNHYGCVFIPGALHSMDTCLPALNALPDIRDKTRLVIGDILEACLMHSFSFPYWKSDYTGDSILMSFDPLAHDRIGLEIFKQLREAKGLDTTSRDKLCNGWLTNSGTAGLGAYEMKNIKLEEIRLG